MVVDIFSPLLEIQYIKQHKLAKVYVNGGVLKYLPESREYRFQKIPFLCNLAWRFGWEKIRPEGVYSVHNERYNIDSMKHTIIDGEVYYKPYVKSLVMNINTGKTAELKSYFDTDIEMDNYVKRISKHINKTLKDGGYET